MSPEMPFPDHNKRIIKSGLSHMMSTDQLSEILATGVSSFTGNISPVVSAVAQLPLHLSLTGNVHIGRKVR